VASIGSYAFYLCSSLESITIPDGVTSIGSAAFQYCRDLTSVTIPDNVTRMGDYAFAYCTGLTSIAIPDSVTIMENNAFFDCTNLTDIYCEAESQPSGWYSEWLNYCDAVVHWGVDFVDSDTEPVATDAPETESSDTTEETTDETTVPETESTESSSPIRDFEEVEMPTDEEKLWSTSFNYYLGVNQLTNPVGSWSWANTFEGKDGCWGLHNDAVFLDGRAFAHRCGASGNEKSFVVVSRYKVNRAGSNARLEVNRLHGLICEFVSCRSASGNVKVTVNVFCSERVV